MHFCPFLVRHSVWAATAKKKKNQFSIKARSVRTANGREDLAINSSAFGTLTCSCSSRYWLFGRGLKPFVDFYFFAI